MGEVTGRVHSIQTLGTVDGPGIRFVLFLQGCNLRCKCCHNPDTWDTKTGTCYFAKEIIETAKKYKEYFGTRGGITVSGGEPLLQAEFVYELFKLAHHENINTCLDTSGCILTDEVKLLLSETDRVLLDIKYTEEELYIANVGCSLSAPLEFLAYLNKEKIPTTIRQVIIPTVNDFEENILKLNLVVRQNTCVDKIELLPFKKICQTKYDQMGITFPFSDIPVPTKEKINHLENLLTKPGTGY